MDLYFSDKFDILPENRLIRVAGLIYIILQGKSWEKYMNMKRLAISASILLLIAVVLGLVISGCASTRIKPVSGSEFMDRAGKIEEISSFSWITYIGCSGQRAYLESGHPAWLRKGTQTTVLWTPLSELPDDIAKQLKAGKPPWKPWNLKQKSELPEKSEPRMKTNEH